MKYTLYIDESGDFQSFKDEWVIAALSVPHDKRSADEMLEKQLSTIASNHGLLPAPDIRTVIQHKLHLCELRGKTPMRTVQSAVLTAALDVSGATFVAVVNESKRELKDPEQTYRLMLLDLLALWESQLGREENVEFLDLVIATRTIDGMQTTWPGLFSKEFRANLPNSVIAGLASRGLLDLFGKHVDIHTIQASQNWGLPVADFLANTLQHRNESEDERILAGLLGKRRLAVFEAFGNFEERRARIAARDGDFGTATIRWLSNPMKDTDFCMRRKRAISQILEQVLTSTGVRGPEAFLERVVDALHRSPLSLGERYTALKQLEDLLSGFSSDTGEHLLLRVRSYMLLIAQHRGDMVESSRILGSQETILRAMNMQVDLLPLVIQMQLRKSESAVNDLNFTSAVEAAKQHVQSITDLESIWNLVFDGSDLPSKTSSIKLCAQMSLIRCEALESVPGTAALNDILARIEQITDIPHDEDRYRLLTYRAMCLLKARRWPQAVEWMKEVAALPGTTFVLFWQARTLNDCLLSGTKIPAGLIHSIRGNLRQAIDLAKREKKHDHPSDLLLRESALLEARYGSQEKGRSDLVLSVNWLRSTVLESPIRDWLECLTRAHTQYISGHEVDPMPLESHWGKRLMEPARDLFANANPGALLLELRLISPY